MQEIGNYLTPKDKKKRINYREQAKKYYIQVMSDPQVQKFIKEHHLTKEQIRQDSSAFVQWYSSIHNTQNAKVLHGYVPVLKYESNHVVLSYKASKELQAQRKEKKRRDNLELINESVSLKDVTMESLYKNRARYKIVQYINKVYGRYKKDPHCLWGGNNGMKGCYLCGDFGVGKTYIMAVLANGLASLGAKVVFLHMPSFITELGEYLDNKDKNIHDLIRRVSNADVLIIDDIGAEKISEWARDNIFSVIMQHRMDNCKLTCFTSNLDIADLTDHFVETNTDISPIKSRRLMERIKFLADPIELIDRDKNGESNDYRLKDIEEDDNLNDMD